MLRLSLLAVAAEQQRAPVPDLTSAVRVDFDFGALYLPAENQVILPIVQNEGEGFRRQPLRDQRPLAAQWCTV